MSGWFEENDYYRKMGKAGLAREAGGEEQGLGDL